MIAAVPNYFAQYQKVSGLVLGFHGCDRDVGESVLCGEVRHLSPSVNDYDWLGSGIYFWENDPQRAYEFAVEASQKPHKSAGKIKDPFVVGAIIDTLHTMRHALSTDSNPLPEYHSVRGAFWEGGELYPGAGFDAKNHIQIAVRKPDLCIRGYFRPISAPT